MIAAARTEKAEAEIETREIVPHDQETNANTAAAKEKPVTVRCNAHSQRNNNEETMGNDNRPQNKTERNTETTEVKKSDNMTVTRDERPGHRMLADDVIDPCDFSSTTMLEVAVRPKCDMDAEKPILQAARPNCDMVAEVGRQRDRERRTPSQARHGCGEDCEQE